MRSATVLHTWADRYALGAIGGQVRRLVGVRDGAWRPIVVLPDGHVWDSFADAATRADLEVVRWTPPPRRRRERWTAPAGASRVRSEAMARIAAVHAHDDHAADQWGPVTRRDGVPLVWDVDLRVLDAGAERRRLAAASYLITLGVGPRLTSRSMLPPHRPAATARGWFRLAAADDGAAQLPAVAIATACDVYACLTGVQPTRASHRAGADTPAAVAG